MNTRTIALALALSGAALPAFAQQATGAQQGAHHGRGQMAGRGHRHGGRGIAQLIARRQQLGLTADQVSRLQAVQQRMEAQQRPLMDQLRALRPDSAHRRGMTAEQRQAFRSRAEPVMKQLREQRQAAMQQVRGILTPAQRQQVATAMRQRGQAFRAGARQRGDAVQRLIARQQQLGLSADQVTRLQAIQQQLAQKNAPVMAQLQRFRPDSATRARLRGGQVSDAQKQAFRAQREQARPLMQQLRENRRAAMEQARSVLTADQQQRIRQQMREGRGKHGEGHGRRGNAAKPAAS